MNDSNFRPRGHVNWESVISVRRLGGTSRSRGAEVVYCGALEGKV